LAQLIVPARSFCQSDQPRRKPIGKLPVLVFMLKFPFYVDGKSMMDDGIQSTTSD
jgi:hypothetical protein